MAQHTRAHLSDTERATIADALETAADAVRAARRRSRRLAQHYAETGTYETNGRAHDLAVDALTATAQQYDTLAGMFRRADHVAITAPIPGT